MNPSNSTSETISERESRDRSRRRIFRVLAILMALLPFILAELGLRWFDVGSQSKTSDPLSGFSTRTPLFEQQGNVFRTTRAREQFFASQEFPVTKPKNGFRFFCFGGSTVYGHPYKAETSFGKWLEMELNSSDPARSYQAINCGGISYASYREAALLKEVLRYEPDLIILATGHNEFLEDRTYESVKLRPRGWAWFQDAAFSLRTVKLAHAWLKGSPAKTENPLDTDESGLSHEVRARLDNASGYASYHRDDVWRENVIAQFDASVRKMIGDCRAARVPIILVKVGSNLRDCPPFKSEHRADLTPDEEREWQKAFDTASSLDASNPKAALDHYRDAEAIDDQYALLAYRIARVLDRLGQIPEALSYYGQARDEDICPLRIIKPLEQSLAKMAVETGSPLLDAARLLSSENFDYIPGFESYLDHVHPGIGGHQKIARALAAQMRESGLLPKTAIWPEEQRRKSYEQHLERLGPRYFAEGRERVNWLENWARRERLLQETLPQDALGHVRLGIRQMDLAEEAAAWRSFDEALKRDASMRTHLQKHADELRAQGRAHYATNLLHRLALSPIGQAGQTRR